MDHITALTAKLDAMQRAMDKLSVKAVDQQPESCVMCGDERHTYEQCPLAQQDEESEQVNSLNSEPSFFPRPPFSRSYSKDPVEQQHWRSNQNNPAPFNNSSARPPFNNNSFQKPPYNNNTWGNRANNNWNNPSPNNNWGNASSSNTNGNRNFYQNASFPNQGNQAAPSDPSRSYAPAGVNDFTHEQGKMNQMMWEQMQSMTTQMAAQSKLLEQLSHIVTSSQPQPGKLPAQPEPNPRGEAKAITLRSGTQYDEPAFPIDLTSPDATSVPVA